MQVLLHFLRRLAYFFLHSAKLSATVSVASLRCWKTSVWNDRTETRNLMI